MKALVIGATGATGKHLVERLLADEQYSSVVILVRQSAGKNHSKLTEHVVDLSRMADCESFIVGDVAFSCLGTTLMAAGSRENQRKIDYTIPVEFATIAKRNQVSSFVLVSASNASAKSRIFYSRIKGELEDTIHALKFPQYVVFRPGLLVREGTDRFGEKLSVKILGILNRLGLLMKYKPLPTTVLADKLVMAPRVMPTGNSILSNQDILDLNDSGSFKWL